ncbi:hypothetical protein DAKH74_035450 [Maudiozyma humilis]|uniref:Uncharacterized protein n=1 Tax=Maudiozyma humilis TaxID=51915 RepID=A0AAV5S2R7_MAUHU|nr:hypothetical protein DAKH74_035450 [Kazachstania humilis]
MDRSVVIVCLTFLMSYLVRSKWFKNLILNAKESGRTLPSVNVDTPGLQLTRHLPQHFNASEGCDLQSLTDVLQSLVSYRTYESGRNERLMARVKLLGEDSINTLNKVGYISKIAEVQNSISVNATVAESIVEYTLAQLHKSHNDEYRDEVARVEGQLAGGNTAIGPDTHRVNEALSHLCRDYNTLFNEREIQPIMKYIYGQMDGIDAVDSPQTLVVVPGSGTGYIPYAIAQQYTSAQVHSIELSGLMYLCNSYMLGRDTTERLSIRPFCQFYSGQENAVKQTQAYEINLDVEKPANLRSLWGNFLEYTPGTTRYDDIVVVTAYFIDTAANMLEYIAQIQSLRQYTTGKVHWINVGPLKYGTHPLVQFTVDELQQYIALQGWKHVDVSLDRNTESGYLTNPDSLYQGHYGLYKFHAVLE